MKQLTRVTLEEVQLTDSGEYVVIDKSTNTFEKGSDVEQELIKAVLHAVAVKEAK